jgi:hypothetical protein
VDDNEFSADEPSTAVENGEFNDEVDDDELGNAISQSSLLALSLCQNNGAFPRAIVVAIFSWTFFTLLFSMLSLARKICWR